jgi:hypothetical protein
MRKIVFVLVLVWCSACGTDDVFPTLSPDIMFATVVPTTPPSTVVLPQIYTWSPITGGSAQVAYPDGWAIQPDGTGEVILLANDANVLTAPDSDLQAQQVGITISLIPTELAGLSVAEGTTPSSVAILQYFLQTQTGGLNGITFGDITNISVGSKNGAQVQGSTAQDDALVLVIEAPNAYVLMSVASDVGQSGTWLQTVYAIGDSVSLTK